MARFLEQRAEILDELHRHDGWVLDAPPGTATCSSCSLSRPDSSPNLALYRCRSCSCAPYACKECIVHHHEHLPFHQVEVGALFLRRCPFADVHGVEQVWDSFWRRVPLADLGHTIYLGHDGGRCPFPDASVMNFILVDVTGLHRVNVAFCSCLGTPHHIQLLRASFYPSSDFRPRSAWTFGFLETFHKVTLQGKLPLYDWYLSILHLTDNACVTDVLVCPLLFYICFPLTGC
jgi:hypothetical protein